MSRLLASVLLAATAACGSHAASPSFSSGADGGGAPGEGDDSGTVQLGPADGATLGNPGGDGGDGCGHLLSALIRDFKPSAENGHPDFERDDYEPADDLVTPGIVKFDLGADGKPVYALPGGSRCTTGPAEFAQWYNDVAGINMAVPVTIPLTPASPGSSTYIYQSAEFFPIDGKGFGNGPVLADGSAPHNFSFTTEVHLSFSYEGGEIFTFSGDDDLWVFINKKLAIDLGGLHPQIAGTADLDALAAKLGIVKGQIYPMDLFQAERHTLDSNFNVTTTIKCFTPKPPK